MTADETGSRWLIPPFIPQSQNDIAGARKTLMALIDKYKLCDRIETAQPQETESLCPV